MKKAFSLLFLTYCVPLFLSVVLEAFIPFSPILTALILDIFSTIVVFFFSLSCNNSSMYDPYWNVAPVVISLYWLEGNNPTSYLFLVLVIMWSIRLTYNCCIHWKGLKDEDWRYCSFRKTTGSFYWPVSFIGIHLFPTLIVFANLAPAYQILTDKPSTLIAPFAGSFLMLAGTILEFFADRQMDRYQKERKNNKECCTLGLWGYSRHPNYLGELSFWWGMFVFSLGYGSFSFGKVLGPIAMTALFLGYSIPAMEKRQLAHRPCYKQIQKQIPMLLLGKRNLAK